MNNQNSNLKRLVTVFLCAAFSAATSAYADRTLDALLDAPLDSSKTKGVLSQTITPTKVPVRTSGDLAHWTAKPPTSKKEAKQVVLVDEVLFPTDELSELGWIKAAAMARDLSQELQLVRAAKWPMSLSPRFNLTALSQKEWSSVNKVEDKTSGLALIVKAFNKKACGNEHTALMRAELEAAAFCKNFTNCVKNYRILETEDFAYVIQEPLVTQARDKLSDVVQYYRHAASSLVSARQSGSIHNDIKPQNIMKSPSTDEGNPSNEAKVIDFDGAQSNEMGKLLNTRHTPVFVSPEKAAIVEILSRKKEGASAREAAEAVERWSGYQVRSFHAKTESTEDSLENTIWKFSNPSKFGGPREFVYDPEKSDVYSLGVSLFVEATAHATERGDNPAAFLSMVNTNPFGSAQNHHISHKIQKDLLALGWGGSPLAKLITSMTHPNPEKRPTLPEVERRLGRLPEQSNLPPQPLAKSEYVDTTWSSETGGVRITLTISEDKLKIKLDCVSHGITGQTIEYRSKVVGNAVWFGSPKKITTSNGYGDSCWIVLNQDYFTFEGSGTDTKLVQYPDGSDLGMFARGAPGSYYVEPERFGGWNAYDGGFGFFRRY